MKIGSDNKATTLDDYDNLSSQMAKATPTGVSFNSYTPKNNPQACPTTDTWQAATNLPPTPNQAVCSCMVSNLTCVAKSDLSSQQIQDQFDYICDPKQGDYCPGIIGNGTTGKYGAFSMCSQIDRLSFAFNQYYLDQTANNPQNNNPCNFKNAASKVSPKPASSCRAVISQAGAAGTGSITNAPTATSGSGSGAGSGSGSGTGSGSGSSSSSKAAGNVLGVPEFNLGLLKFAAYITSAVLVGAGMVLL